MIQHANVAKGSKNITFMKQMMTLTGVKTLAEVQGKWRFERLIDLHKEVVPGFDNCCEACHSGLDYACQIVRVDDADSIAHIGSDCMEKLVYFNVTGLIESVNPASVRKLRSELRTTIEEGIRDAGAKKPRVASILSWLKERKSSLPLHLQKSIEFMDAFGYPYLREHALALVAEYKAHRPFALETVLTREEIDLYRKYGHECKIDKIIYLNDLPRVRAQLKSAEAERILRWTQLWQELSAGPIALSSFDEMYSGGYSLSMFYKGVEVRVGLPEPSSIDARCFNDPDLRNLTVRLLGCRAHYPESNSAVVEMDPTDRAAVIAAAKQARDKHFAMLERERQQKAEQRSATIQRVVTEGLRKEQLTVHNMGWGGSMHIVAHVEDVSFTMKLSSDFPLEWYQETLPEHLQIVAVRATDAGARVEFRLTEEFDEQWRLQLKARKDAISEGNRKIVEEKIATLSRQDQYVRLFFKKSYYPRKRDGRLMLEWRAWRDGIKYVLARRDSYEGQAVLCVKGLELVPGKVYVVHRVYLSEEHDGNWVARANHVTLASSREQ
jgi:hypothetical protein